LRTAQLQLQFVSRQPSEGKNNDITVDAANNDSFSKAFSAALIIKS
jgi:hypothetical protein